MSPSRTSWSSPPPVVPSCAVLGTMRLLLRWCGVEASPRQPPTQAAAGGLPDQRRFRGRLGDLGFRGLGLGLDLGAHRLLAGPRGERLPVDDGLLLLLRLLRVDP